MRHSSAVCAALALASALVTPLGCLVEPPTRIVRCESGADCASGGVCVAGVCERSEGADESLDDDGGPPLRDSGLAPTDAGIDGGAVRDAGPLPDGGLVPDAGLVLDAGALPDGGLAPDSGRVDSGTDGGSDVVDSGPDLVDAGPDVVDAGPDAGPDGGPDAGPPDDGCRDCVCAASTSYASADGLSCTRSDVQASTVTCVADELSCPGCVTSDQEVAPPSWCRAPAAGTCSGAVPPSWVAAPNGTSCGAGCECVGGTRTETNCSDPGPNEDGDSVWNCEDPDCLDEPCGVNSTCRSTGSGVGCIPLTEQSCSLVSGDEDQDGLLNCADFDCNNATCGGGCRCKWPGPTETNCDAYSGDEDGDGLYNCADNVDCPEDASCGGTFGTARCGADAVCHEVACTCNGLVDNDNDGFDDCDDPDCDGKRTSSCAAVCAP